MDKVSGIIHLQTNTNSPSNTTTNKNKMLPAFISAGFPLPRRQTHLARTISPRMCTPSPMDEPKPPRDPTELRTESEKRRNQPVKPMKRRARRGRVDDPIDWENLPSVPLVRSEASPESGEDYWVDIGDTTALGAAIEEEKKGEERAPVKKPIDENLKNRLKEEVVSPYTQNWILRVTALIVVLIVLVALFGGTDKVPIIPVPDL